MVSSTTPRFGPRWPLVLDTVSIRTSRISLARAGSWSGVSAFRSRGLAMDSSILTCAAPLSSARGAGPFAWAGAGTSAESISAPAVIARKGPMSARPGLRRLRASLGQLRLRRGLGLPRVTGRPRAHVPHLGRQHGEPRGDDDQRGGAVLGGG